MDSLKAKLDLHDIEVLIEAVGEWESLGNQDYYIAQQVKNIPLPDEEENEDAYKYISAVKKHFAEREKDIKAARAVRQEQSTFLRAKLFMMKQSQGVEKLWEAPESSAIAAPKEKDIKVVKEPKKDKKEPKSEVKEPKEPKKAKPKTDDWQLKYEIAEKYMEDLQCIGLFNTSVEKLAADELGDWKSKYDAAETYLMSIKCLTLFKSYLEEKLAEAAKTEETESDE